LVELLLAIVLASFAIVLFPPLGAGDEMSPTETEGERLVLLTLAVIVVVVVVCEPSSSSPR